ncbi:hypothetical protein JOE61_001954 [Nocardioides salarius]|uniref:DUF2269 family protein n=1 Tax=Nocardioides salarius TaxID=374513 RepID=A0ABS2MAE0_9ACTN|nr:hypothetical protein [Nocardioides salarius]MBM7508140.1 hypothetical protein [Nocardioides salarius]
MELTALAFAVLTAMVGSYMAGLLLRTGRPASTATRSRLPSWAVLGHGFLALVGIAVWIIYVLQGSDGLAWAGLVVFVLAASGGTLMFLRWRLDRRGSRAEVERRKRDLAEQQIPSSAVHLHGALAFGTLVLVLLVAVDVG